MEDAVAGDAATGQVVGSAAEVYESFFVPALFGQWPERVLDLCGAGEGQSLLDVGCGTGVLARAAVDRVGPAGSVTGLDPNPGMLAVARARGAGPSWVEGAAEGMPFPDDSFDVVVSEFSLMFFRDRGRGVAEMARVARPGGRVVAATWAGLGTTPGYAAMVDLLERLLGAERADALRAPFVLGTADLVREAVGDRVDDLEVHRVEGTARFASVEAWVHTDVRGWTLADAITDDEHARLLEAARRDLTAFVGPDGSVAFDAPALVALGRAR